MTVTVLVKARMHAHYDATLAANGTVQIGRVTQDTARLAGKNSLIPRSLLTQHGHLHVEDYRWRVGINRCLLLNSVLVSR